MNGSSGGLQIGPVPPADQRQALELIFDRSESADRRQQIENACDTHRSDGPMPGGLVGAWRDGRLVGAMLLQVQPGKTAAVWLPRLEAGESESTAAALMADGWTSLDSQGVVLAQVVLEQVGETEETLLHQGGFAHLADLLYLVSQKSGFPTALPASELAFESYREISHLRLAEIIDATYDGTLDCPKLEGVRKTEDVLEGYRAGDEFDPSRWLIARHANRDIGCLLLADHPQYDNMELLYMGVVRTARGHGWGRQLARHAQWLAHRAGRARLVLAVDSINTPAIQTYMAVGFRTWQQRRLYIKRLHVH